MPRPVTAWRPENAWTPFASAGRGGATAGPPGVRIDLVPPLPLTTLIARDELEGALGDALSAKLGCALGASRSTNGRS